MLRDADDGEHVADWPAVHLLTEPNRRLIYDALRAARRPLTRDDVAAQCGLSRRLATFHLDHLADVGLAVVDYARPEGRRGPGAGRPAKRYAARDVDVAVSVPPRRYDVVARILAAGVRDAAAATTAADAAAADAAVATHRAAVAEGRAVGERWALDRALSRRATLTRSREALDALGYEPRSDDAGSVSLANCPFHAAVDVAPELVCGLNASFLGGLLEGMDGHPDVVATLCPAPPDCCVRITGG